MLALLLTSSCKSLGKWQGPFKVTQPVGDIDYEVRQTDRGGVWQIYQLNLLKLWRVGVPVVLATVISER